MYVARHLHWLKMRNTNKFLGPGIREALRFQPPVPTGLPRVIAEGGNIVLDKWVPEGTRVSVHQMATFHSPANFK